MTELGWGKGNGNIINMSDVDGVTQDVINKYGYLTTYLIRTQAAAWIDQDVRAAQNNKILTKLLVVSISTKVRQKIFNEEAAISISGIRAGTLF